VRLPRSWCLPQGKSASSQAGLAGERPKPEPEWQAPQWAWEWEDQWRAMPRWKRFVLRNVVPVCLAMVWQLGVVIGFLVILLLGLILLELL
jgi:hypothetical protein